jgi:hypothetical protein
MFIRRSRGITNFSGTNTSGDPPQVAGKELLAVLSNADYLNTFPASNLNRTKRAAVLIAQARLLLLREATETTAWRLRQGYRETADRLHIHIALLEKLSGSEVANVR